MVLFPHFSWRALALATLTTLSAGAAMAQWQWIDGTGSRVFSDTPPPAGTPDKNILKRPGGARPTAAPSAPPSGTLSTASTPAAAPKPSGKDSELETRKKQATEAEQAKKKAEQDKLVKARADNCERARRAKNTVDSGVRIATRNAKGETEFLDDKARAAEAQRIEGVVKSECGPLPQAAQ
ncbi:DUF4124 domain-containing protein [Hydrogenophaga sp.]|uniref:DUF4124 domain-containing protein n=1 Tax=Hydrogenophaga sp. TaxID=1904254 RepID=UPI00286E2B2F|nr:DUF4124 domain-containing protein [Hydrogenophaga sp.]